MGGALFSGLVGGYANTMLDEKRRQREEQDKKIQAELEVLRTAAASGQLSPEAMAATFSRMEELVSEYGSGKSGKAKGAKGIFGNLIGRFGDTGGAQAKGGRETGGTGAGTPAPPSGPVTTSGHPGIPMDERTPIGGSSTQLPPGRGQLFKPGSFQDPDQKKILTAVKMQHALYVQTAQDMYGKPPDQLTPSERAEVVHASYGTPQTKMHPIIVDKGDGKPVPALQDTSSGAVVGQDGQIIPNAVEWKAPPSLRPVAYVDEKGRIRAGEQDPKTMKVFDPETHQEVVNPRIIPPGGAAGSVTDTTSEHVDPITGEKYTTHSHSVRSKVGVPGTEKPPTREQATGGGGASAAPPPRATKEKPKTPEDIRREKAHRENRTLLGKDVQKLYTQHEDAIRNLELMKKDEEEARTSKHPGAADMDLISRHIAMTFGEQVRGTRGGQYLIEKHIKARDLEEELNVMAQKVTTGGQLSPQQRNNFVALAQRRVDELGAEYMRMRKRLDTGEEEATNEDELIERLAKKHAAPGTR